MNDVPTDEKIKAAVRQAYGATARRFVDEPVLSPVEGAAQTSCGCPGTAKASCCSPVEAVDAAKDITARLYSMEGFADLPDSVTDASMGCGSPVALAELQPGEVVLDLGSGGGLDCFLAAKKVGLGGRVIGLDMTPEMIRLARRNAKKVEAMNVEFRYGEIEDIPLPDESVDVIISNCVINLSPDKDTVFREAYRVLRPGGRMIVSDIVVHGELPRLIRNDLVAWAGCVAGALEETDYLDKIRAAGFKEVEVLSRNYVKISETAEWGLARATLVEAGLSPHALDLTVVSERVRARKPA